MLMTGYGVSGSDHDFYAYAADGESTVVAAVEGDAIGGESRYTATMPAGTVRYELRYRGVDAAGSYMAWEQAVWASQASVDAVRAKTDLLGAAGTEVAQIINTGVGAGGKLRFRKGDAFGETFAVPGVISSDDRIVLTVKADRSDADDAAILKVDSASGLVVIEGNVPGSGQTGSVSIVDANERTIRLVLSADAAAALNGRAQAAHYDVKRFPPGGGPKGVAIGLATIAHAVTHEV